MDVYKVPFDGHGVNADVCDVDDDLNWAAVDSLRFLTVGQKKVIWWLKLIYVCGTKDGDRVHAS